jgi:predicted RNA polymerase sigma factor
MPVGDVYAERLSVVLQVLYLIFNEGYATTAGEHLQRSDLTAEAIRLTRMVHRSRPEDDEVTGLLALMLLTDARRPARTDEHGDLVPMAEQDRSRWNADDIREGAELLTAAVAHHNPGPYQIQAAIAALHDEAPTAEATDWVQIQALYEVLLRGSDNPVVALNHVVAVAMAEGAAAGRARLAEVAADPRIAEHPRFLAVSAHLLEMAGDHDAARTAYAEAARRSPSIPQQRYLNGRAARLASNPEASPSPGR